MSFMKALPKLIAKTFLGEPPKPPVLEAPKPMPEPDGEAVQKTKQRAMINQQQRQGRASTMLSDSYDKLG